MKAAIYTRISSDPNDQRLGVERQEADCRALAAANGWSVIEPAYIDNDISAYSGKDRPAYRRMLADIDAGRVGVVIAQHPDRLYRRTRDLLDLIDLLDRTKTQVSTVLAGKVDLASANGRTMAKFAAVIAEGESERKSELVRRKHLELAERGRLSGGGHRAFGREDEGITIREDEAALIREAARDILDGRSLRSIVNRWNARGIPTVRGTRWSPTVVRQMLTAARTAGLRSYKGTVLDAPCDWPAIITPEQREALITVLGDRRHQAGRLVRDPSQNGRGRPPKYLLSGIARCGICGLPLYGKRGTDGKVTYTCQTDNGGCGRIRILAEPVDSLVEDRLLDKGLRPLPPDPVEHARHSAKDSAKKIATKLRGYRLRLDRLDDDYWLHGRLDEGRHEQLRTKLERLIEESQQELTEAVIRFQRPDTGRRPFPEWWSTADLEARRAEVLNAFDKIEIRPAGKARNRFDPERVNIV